MSKYVDETWLDTETCCACGMVFAMPADFMRRRRNDRVTFYCPAGHSQHCTGKTEEQRLKDELERMKVGRGNARTTWHRFLPA